MYKIAVLLILMFLSACHKSHEQYNGYIDVDLTYLSSDYSGRLQTLLVNRGESVKKGQLLFKVEQTNQKYSVAMSQFTTSNLLSQRQEIVNNLDYSISNHKRILQMRHQNAASQQDLELAQRDKEVLENQLKAIDFQIKNSQVDTSSKQWEVDKKEGHASEDGIIFDTYYTKAEYVAAGQPVVSLITKKKIKVVFFVPEIALIHLRLNEKVRVFTDGNESLAVGRIRYISKIAQYTSPLIYSRENRQSLVFRVEASIDNPDLTKLHLGQPISLSVSE